MNGVWRISSKIMLAVMLCASLLAAAIGGVVLHQSNKIIEINTYDNLELIAGNYADIFSKSTEQVEFTLNAYVSSIAATFDEERLETEGGRYLKEYQDQVLLELTRQFATDNKNILGVYFDFDPYLDEDLGPRDQTYGAWYLDRNLNGIIERDRMELKKNFYPGNPKMGWYYNALQQKKGVWSTPYKDIYTEYEMISYNLPFIVNGKVIGVAGIDMTFQSVKSIIEQFKVFETGYAYLLSEDFNVIVSPKSEKLEINKSILELNPDYQKLIDAIEGGTSKNITLGTRDEKTVLSYGKMSNGYTVVIAVKENEIFKDLNRVVTRIDLIILIGTLVSAFIAYFLGKYIARPVEAIQRKLNRMAQLDLRKENRTVRYFLNGEGEKMVREAEQVREEIAGTIFNIQKSLKEEALTLEQLDRVINKLDIVLARLSISFGPDSKADQKINKTFDYYLGESKSLLLEAKEKRDDIEKINKKNQVAVDCYHLND